MKPVLALVVVGGCVTPQFGSHPPPRPPLASPEILTLTLACDVDQNAWKLAVTTSAWSGGGGSVWTEDGEYVEDHDVPVLTYEEDGSGETLELDLAIVSDWRDQAQGSTVFTCGDTPSVLFTLFDTTGAVVACRWFPDPTAEPADCPVPGS